MLSIFSGSEKSRGPSQAQQHQTSDLLGAQRETRSTHCLLCGLKEGHEPLLAWFYHLSYGSFSSMCYEVTFCTKMLQFGNSNHLRMFNLALGHPRMFDKI